MKLLPTQIDERSLSTFGEEACTMLMRHDDSGLANRFGYALAYCRDPAVAIETDFLGAAASSYCKEHVEHRFIAVKYFSPNVTGLFAVVECTVPVTVGAAVVLKFIVTGKGEEKYISIEDISGVAV